LSIKNVKHFLLTNSLKQFELAVAAVAKLGGDNKSIDTEDVAVEAHRTAPSLFSWRKYPELPNLELVRVALSDAKKPTHGGLLSGSGRNGWMLTKAGLAWVKAHATGAQLAASTYSSETRTAGSVDTRRQHRERSRIVNSSAWAAWTGRRKVSTPEAEHVFRIDQYATTEIRERKIVRLISLFQTDNEITEFLDHISEIVSKA
jgi:hypothetical protein